MGSSGVALVGYRFRLSYARCRNRSFDSDNSRSIANRESFRKVFTEIFRCFAGQNKNTFGVSRDYDLGNALRCAGVAILRAAASIQLRPCA